METTTPATPPADSPKSLGTALAAITLADDASEDEFEWTERKPESQKRSLPSHPTGFWLFANAHFGQSVTKKKDFHGSNRVFLNATFGKLKNKITECAQPLWNKMTEEEKKVWHKRAQNVKLVTNPGSRKLTKSKRAQFLLSDHEDLEGDDEFLPLEQAVPAVVNKENKKYSSDFKKISDWLGTGSKNGGMDLADIKRTRFVFASIQTYGDLDREVIPAEIALAEFSLRHGILDLYSTIVGPWEITNNVLRFRANFNCKETHQIPIDLKEMLQKKIKFSFKKQVTAEILGRVEPFIAHKQGLRVGLYKERILEFDDEYDIRQSEAETGKLGASSFAQHLSDIKPLLPGPDEDHRWVICLDHEYESILTALEHLKTDVQLEYDGFPTSPERFILASAFVDAFLQNVDERSKSVDSAKLFGGLGSPQFAEGSMPWEANARLFCSYHRKEHNTCCASFTACGACLCIFHALKESYSLDFIE